MRICVHRGTQEIGGTCIEVESQGKRIVLDVGLPLDGSDRNVMPLHPVPGFATPDPSLLGVLISHPHQDHYGLACRLPESTTFLIGRTAHDILKASSAFVPDVPELKHVIHFEDRRPITLGPFTITPYLVDHSAYDSYAILVEADGKRLFYSGDFRAHGRKSKLVDQLIAHPPKDVDVLLMEGTTLGRPETAQGFPSEEDLVPAFVDLFKETDGLALVWASGQNIDRLVTIYKACRRAGRQLIIDPYINHILQATGNDRIPRAGWKDIRIFAPRSQRLRIKRDESFDLINPLRAYRIFPKGLLGAAANSVLLFRPSMIQDLDAIDGLKIGRLVHSLWQGYLADGQNQSLLDWLDGRSIPLDYCHTSGHADREVLVQFRNAFASATLVPIHGEHPNEFLEWHGQTRLLDDGQWVAV